MACLVLFCREEFMETCKDGDEVVGIDRILDIEDHVGKGIGLNLILEI